MKGSPAKVVDFMEESSPLQLFESPRAVMETELSKAELLRGVKVLPATALDAQALQKAEQNTRLTGSLDGVAIARAEMARRRSRLGTLTSRQEIAIEDLLLSTVNRISELVGRALDANTVKTYGS